MQSRKEKTEMGCDGSFLHIGDCFKEDTRLFGSTIGCRQEGIKLIVARI